MSVHNHGPAEGRDPVKVVQVRLHRTPGVECSHIEGKQPACWRDAFRAVSALRANGLLP